MIRAAMGLCPWAPCLCLDAMWFQLLIERTATVQGVNNLSSGRYDKYYLFYLRLKQGGDTGASIIPFSKADTLMSIY